MSREEEASIAGFVKGFHLAYAARARRQAIYPAQIRRLQMEVASRAFPYQEQEDPLQQAYGLACFFALNAVDLLLAQRPQAEQRYQEWQSWPPVQRETYAREMAEHFLPYL